MKNTSENTGFLDKLDDEKLLSLLFCDLDLKISGTPFEEHITRLYKELDNAGIVFKPECYLADEWLTPDDEPVIGVAFYLAHPRFIKSAKKSQLRKPDRNHGST